MFLLFWTGNGRDVPRFGSERPGIGKKLWADFVVPYLQGFCREFCCGFLSGFYVDRFDPRIAPMRWVLRMRD